MLPSTVVVSVTGLSLKVRDDVSPLEVMLSRGAPAGVLACLVLPLVPGFQSKRCPVQLRHVHSEFKDLLSEEEEEQSDRRLSHR